MGDAARLLHWGEFLEAQSAVRAAKNLLEASAHAQPAQGDLFATAAAWMLAVPGVSTHVSDCQTWGGWL